MFSNAWAREYFQAKISLIVEIFPNVRQKSFIWLENGKMGKYTFRINVEKVPNTI